MTTRYYTKWAIEKIIKGKMDPMVSLQSNAVMPEPTAITTTTSSDISDDSSTPIDQPSLASAPTTITTYRPIYQHRLPDATSRKAIEYYRDPKHRGYLSYQVDKGQGPSLFFKTPHQGIVKKRIKGVGKVRGVSENRVW